MKQILGGAATPTALGRYGRDFTSCFVYLVTT